MSTFDDQIRQARQLEEHVRREKQLEELARPHRETFEAQRAVEASMDLVSAGLASVATRDYSLPSLTVPDMSSMYRQMEDLGRTAAEAREAPTARRAVQRIEAEIRRFEEALDEETEVALRLVAFGQIAVVHVDEISYYQPNLVVFAGRNEKGSPVRLMQHISQLSFILCSEPRLEPDTPRRPVGFVVPEDDAGRAD